MLGTLVWPGGLLGAAFGGVVLLRTLIGGVTPNVLLMAALLVRVQFLVAAYLLSRARR